jgi:hypothetical protein
VDLYTITVEGTKLRQVTDLPGKELAPTGRQAAPGWSTETPPDSRSASSR